MNALTMRRLGKELGVEAMSLYTYVASKQDLLDGVLECVYQEMPKVISVDGPWQERLRSASRAFRQVLLRHPNTVALLAARPVRNEGSLNLVESSLGELTATGLKIDQADQVLSLIVAFTVGHVASEVGDGYERPIDDFEAFHRSLDRGRYPNVVARSAHGPPNRDKEFALGLDFIVAGIEQLINDVVVAPKGKRLSSDGPV